jgi:hypothetical protein
MSTTPANGTPPTTANGTPTLDGNGAPATTGSSALTTGNGMPAALSCWENALGIYSANLTNDPKKLDQIHQLQSQASHRSNLNEIMAALQRTVTRAEANQWRVNVTTGNVVRAFSVREKVNDIMRRLQTYASIGDVVSQAGGPIAVGVWGIFRFLLQTGLDESKSSQQVVAAITVAMDSTTRAAAYEQLFLPSGWLPGSPSAAGQNDKGDSADPGVQGRVELRRALYNSISGLYAETIRFALKAQRFFEIGTTGPFGFSPAPLKTHN